MTGTRIACGGFGLGLLFLLAGCSELPASYRRVELGKPFDPSALPGGAMIEEFRTTPRVRRVTEYEQLYVPVGMIRYTLDITTDDAGRVTRVELERNSVYFWLLFLSGGEKQQRRFLEGADERAQEWSTGVKFVPIWSLMFPMGLHQCFGGEARDWRSAHQPGRAPATAPGH